MRPALRRHALDPMLNQVYLRIADVRDGLVTVTDATGTLIAIIDPHTRVRTEVPRDG